MRSLILLGLIVILSSVSCKEHFPRYRDNISSQKYKDRKNKRGIGDYPFSLPYGGSSYPNIQSSSPLASPLTQGFPGFSGYNNYGNSLGISHNPFGQSAQPLSALSSLGSNSIGSLGGYNILGKTVNLGQNSGYSLPSSNLNLFNSLSSHGSGQEIQSSSSLGLFTPEKTGPVTFNAQAASSGQSQQQYTPVYATANQLGSSSYVVPVILGASQGSSLQSYSLPSSLSNLNTRSPQISSLSAGNGVSSYVQASDSSPQAVTGSYVIASVSPQQTRSASNYAIPLSSLSSSPSSGLAISIPASSYSSGSASSGSVSGSSNSYRLPITASIYAATPSGSPSSSYTKYAPTTSEGGSYLGDQLRNYGAVIKVSSYTTPNTNYSNSNYGYTGASGASYASDPSYSSGSSGSSSSESSKSPVTSYGTPAMSYTIPSTNYGTPNYKEPISSSNYNGHSSNRYPNSGGSSYSSYGKGYNALKGGSSYQSDSSYGNNRDRYEAPVVSYSPNSNYESGPSSNDISSYKSAPPNSGPPSLSNSLENYSSTGSSNSYGEVDSGSSYSSYSPRYLKYPGSRILSPVHSEDSIDSSSYDTISYSVPVGRY